MISTKTPTITGMRKTSVRHLLSLQHPSGLFSASTQDAGTGYDKSWIRDCLYEAIGLEHAGHKANATKAYRALLDVLKKHEMKIDWALAHKPTEGYQYIHARFHPETFEEFHEPWGNKQNDSIGLLLFQLANCKPAVRDVSDLRIISKLVRYLEMVEYWHDSDNGIWEENAEIHASSIGACVAGLKAISRIVDVPAYLIERGEAALLTLLPRESITKDADLALLTLIYPLNIVSWKHRLQILEVVESRLQRQRGFIRYHGDRYYNQGGEAEWTFAFPWLAKIYRDMGDTKKFRFYLAKTHEVMNLKAELPELYYSNSAFHNENSPLGWAQALYLVATKGMTHAHGENKIETSRFIPS